jgi:hypothetical protein
MGGMNPSNGSAFFETIQGNLLFGEQLSPPSVELHHEQLVHCSMGGPIQPVSSIFHDVVFEILYFKFSFLSTRMLQYMLRTWEGILTASLSYLLLPFGYLSWWPVDCPSIDIR